MATRTSEEEPAAAGIINTLPEDGVLPEELGPQTPDECINWLNESFFEFRFFTTLRSASGATVELDADKALGLRGMLEQIGAEKLHAAGLRTVEIYDGKPEKDRMDATMFWYSLTATRAQNLAALCAAYDIPEPQAHAAEEATQVGAVEPTDSGDKYMNAVIAAAKSQKRIHEWTFRATIAVIAGAGIVIATNVASILKSRETERPAAAVAAAPSQTPTPSLQITHDCRVRVARLSSGKKGFRASCDMTREQGITPGFEWVGPEQTAKDGTRTQPGRITIKVPDMVTGDLKEICVTTDPISVVKKPETDIDGIQEFPGRKFTCGKAPQ